MDMRRFLLLKTVWIALALLTICADIITGPYIQFPILFLIPICGAAWFGHPRLAYGMSLIMPMAAAEIIMPGVTGVWTLPIIITNTVVRMFVLLAFSYMLSRIAEQNRSLAKEVKLLEGLLPICSFCKKIRKEDGSWEQIEAYVSHRTDARFSHGICPECAKTNYPDIFK